MHDRSALLGVTLMLLVALMSVVLARSGLAAIDEVQHSLNIDHESAEVVALRLSAIGLPGMLTGVHAGQVDVVPMKVVQVLVIQNQFVRHCYLLSTPPHSATIHVARPQVLQGEFAEIVGRGRDDQTHGTGRPGNG